jgi:S-adenosylmethionine uptake transporter
MPIPRSGTAGLGVVLYLAGIAMFAVNDALGKWLVADYGVGQLMLLRTIGAGAVLAPLVLSLRVKLIDPRRPGLQVLRVLCAAADTFAFYYATRYMPLADVMTFYMATPLIITALSRRCLAKRSSAFAGSRFWSASLASSLRSGLRRICCPGPRRSRSWERSPMR